MPLFEAHGDDYGLARAWRLRSEVGRLVCRFGEEAAALERALVHAEAAGEEREVGRDQALARQLPLLRADAGRGCARADGRACWSRHTACAGSRPRSSACAGTCSRWPTSQTRHAPSTRGVSAIFEELGMSFANAARAVIPAGIEQMAGDLEAAERELRLRSRSAGGDRRERAALDDRGDARPGPLRAGAGRRGGAVRACQHECGRGGRRRLAGAVAIGARQGHRAARRL